MGRAGEEARLDKWDLRFLRMARAVAGWSKDRSTKCGAVLVRDRRVLSTGYNGFPPGVDDEDDRLHGRPIKYYVTEHAERNALYNAAVHGVSTAGATAYVFGLHPCARCVRGLLLAKVEELVFGYDSDRFPDGRSPNMDALDFDVASELLELVPRATTVGRPLTWWNESSQEEEEE